MRKANIAKISLLIFIIEPSIWRLRHGSKKILQGVTIPNANAFKNYSKDSSQTRVLRNVASSQPKRSCGSKENTSQSAFFTALRIVK